MTSNSRIHHIIRTPRHPARFLAALLLAASCAQPTHPPKADPGLERGITVIESSNLEGWLPEGAPDGNELIPGPPDKDLVVYCSWRGGGDPRTLYATLKASNHPGSCTNAGSLACADMTIEASRNSEWRIVGPDIPEYEGLQSANIGKGNAVTARTAGPVESGRVVELRLSCYDWGGSSRLTVFADGCKPVELK